MLPHTRARHDRKGIRKLNALALVAGSTAAGSPAAGSPAAGSFNLAQSNNCAELNNFRDRYALGFAAEVAVPVADGLIKGISHTAATTGLNKDSMCLPFAHHTKCVLLAVVVCNATWASPDSFHRRRAQDIQNPPLSRSLSAEDIADPSAAEASRDGAKPIQAQPKFETSALRTAPGSPSAGAVRQSSPLADHLPASSSKHFELAGSEDGDGQCPTTYGLHFWSGFGAGVATFVAATGVLAMLEWCSNRYIRAHVAPAPPYPLDTHRIHVGN